MPPTSLEPESVPAEIAFERDPANRIDVPERILALHPFVVKTRDALKEINPLHYGRALLFPRDGCLSVNVSKEHVPRALRIMHALLKAMEQRGYALSLPDKGSGLSVNVLGATLVVSLEEKTKQVRREPEPSTSRGATGVWRSSQPYDLVPTGVLCLRFRDKYRMTCQVTDTASRVLEDRLNEFIVKLLEEGFAERRRREEREKEQLARQEAERVRREDEARAAKEKEKVDQWDRWMTAWRRAQDVRAFAAAIREALAPIEEGSTLGEWLVWAATYADRIDPLTTKQNADR
jgi:hypothetical protein